MEWIFDQVDPVFYMMMMNLGGTIFILGMYDVSWYISIFIAESVFKNCFFSTTILCIISMIFISKYKRKIISRKRLRRIINLSASNLREELNCIYKYACMYVYIVVKLFQGRLKQSSTQNREWYKSIFLKKI